MRFLSVISDSYVTHKCALAATPELKQALVGCAQVPRFARALRLNDALAGALPAASAAFSLSLLAAAALGVAALAPPPLASADLGKTLIPRAGLAALTVAGAAAAVGCAAAAAWAAERQQGAQRRAPYANSPYPRPTPQAVRSPAGAAVQQGTDCDGAGAAFSGGRRDPEHEPMAVAPAQEGQGATEAQPDSASGGASSKDAEPGFVREGPGSPPPPLFVDVDDSDGSGGAAAAAAGHQGRFIGLQQGCHAGGWLVGRTMAKRWHSPVQGWNQCVAHQPPSRHGTANWTVAYVKCRPAGRVVCFKGCFAG